MYPTSRVPQEFSLFRFLGCNILGSLPSPVSLGGLYKNNEEYAIHGHVRKQKSTKHPILLLVNKENIIPITKSSITPLRTLSKQQLFFTVKRKVKVSIDDNLIWIFRPQKFRAQKLEDTKSHGRCPLILGEFPHFESLQGSLSKNVITPITDRGVKRPF